MFLLIKAIVLWRSSCRRRGPSDWNVDAKQEEKINKYPYMAREIKELWKIKEVNTIDILGTVHRRFEECLRNINVGVELALLHKTVLLGSATI